MVEFRKDGYSIHVELGYNPVEDWMELVNELLMLIVHLNADSNYHPWRTADFIQHMLPEWEVAKKMVPSS